MNEEMNERNMLCAGENPGRSGRERKGRKKKKRSGRAREKSAVVRLTPLINGIGDDAIHARSGNTGGAEVGQLGHTARGVCRGVWCVCWGERERERLRMIDTTTNTPIVLIYT